MDWVGVGVKSCITLAGGSVGGDLAGGIGATSQAVTRNIFTNAIAAGLGVEAVRICTTATLVVSACLSGGAMRILCANNTTVFWSGIWIVVRVTLAGGGMIGYNTLGIGSTRCIVAADYLAFPVGAGLCVSAVRVC